MKKLKPVVYKEAHAEPIQKKIDFLLFSIIYKPFLDFIKKEMHIEIKNANASALIEALQAGVIVYSKGRFYGKFEAKTSRELLALGATFHKPSFAYKLDITKVPADVLSAASFGAARYAGLQKKAMDILQDTEKNVLASTYKADFEPELNKVFTDLGNQFEKTTAESISIAPDFSGGIREKLIETYNTNANLAIKGVQDKAVVRLRGKVTANMTEGFRADKLEKILINEFSMTAKRARFISEQETSLLVSKYRKERYTSVGLNKYRWNSSRDSRVRPDHAVLHGKIFTFDNPPITNKATGARNNPGEDFGPCRCVAEPVFD